MKFKMKPVEHYLIYIDEGIKNKKYHKEKHKTKNIKCDMFQNLKIQNMRRRVQQESVF